MTSPILSIAIFLVLLSFYLSFHNKTSCQPRPVYMMWYKLRTYVATEIAIMLPSNSCVLPLKIMKCPKYDISLCNTVNQYCGVHEQEYVTKILPLDSKDFIALNLTFLQDSSCKCVNRFEYIEQLPFVLNAALIKRESKWTRVVMYKNKKIFKPIVYINDSRPYL